MAQTTVEDVAKLQQANKDAQSARVREFATAHAELIGIPDAQKDAGWQAKMDALKTAFRADIGKMIGEHRDAEHALVIEAATASDAAPAAKHEDDAA